MRRGDSQREMKSTFSILFLTVFSIVSCSTIPTTDQVEITRTGFESQGNEPTRTAGVPQQGESTHIAEGSVTSTYSPAPTNTFETMPAPFIVTDLKIIDPGIVKDLQIVAQLEVPNVYFVTISPDNSKLATILQEPADRSWSVQIWDLHGGIELFTVRGGPKVFFSPDSNRLATLTGDGILYWDAVDGEEIGSINHNNIQSMSRDWQFIATDSYDMATDRSIINIIELLNGFKLHSLPVDGTLVDVRFSPGGNTLAITTGGISSETTIWDMTTGEKLFSFQHVDRFIYSPDGQLMAGSFGPDRVIEVFDSQDFTFMRDLNNQKGPHPQFLAFTPDGRILAATLGNGIRLWDTGNGQELTTFTRQAGYVAFSPDGRLMVTTEFPGTINFWGVSP